jgi:hypothetical protein
VNGDCIFHADTRRVIWEMSDNCATHGAGVDEAAAEGKGTAEQGGWRSRADVRFCVQ